MSKEAERESLTITGRVRGSSEPKSVFNKEEEQGEKGPKTARREIFKVDLESDWERRRRRKCLRELDEIGESVNEKRHFSGKILKRLKEEKTRVSKESLRETRGSGRFTPGCILAALEW